ncbi:MAG: hypothetical protein EA383_09555 [Spirochaetaceae bacterium]|nr:MAG: hypothetical protein EA383_09555 [Spirochaetaceae bacterium]
MVHKVRMKSVTIHGIDEALMQKITEASKERGTSRNRTIKELLQSTLMESEATDHAHDFDDLFGVWSVQEKAEFDAAVRDFSRVDEADWNES